VEKVQQRARENTRNPKEEKKCGKSYMYSDQLIMLLLFLKFAIRLSCRQTEGVARKGI